MQFRRFAALLAALFVLALSVGCSKGVTDGMYTVQVDTDSSMFRVEECVLTVQDGQMTAEMSLPGQGFSRLYFGTAEEAEAAAATGELDSGIYDYYLNGEGLYTFDVPVSALDQEIQVAAFGHRRDTWYDHVIVVHAPEPSDRIGDVPDADGDAEAGDVEDSGGQAAASTIDEDEFQVEVELEGGTGRAFVESPATAIAEADGTYTLVVVWSSPHYDLMIVDGEEYLPVNAEGNSMFEIPVQTLDEPLEFQAETTAMSEPHTIDYVLHFNV